LQAKLEHTQLKILESTTTRHPCLAQSILQQTQGWHFVERLGSALRDGPSRRSADGWSPDAAQAFPRDFEKVDKSDTP
jgi:hypothetical protein